MRKKKGEDWIDRQEPGREQEWEECCGRLWCPAVRAGVGARHVLGRIWGPEREQQPGSVGDAHCRWQMEQE